VQQASLKWPHDDDTTKQRRRSSLKRQSTGASSGNPFKRSVHFEAPSTQQPQEMQMSLSELSQSDGKSASILLCSILLTVSSSPRAKGKRIPKAFAEQDDKRTQEKITG
jgi:hypothetical protein